MCREHTGLSVELSEVLHLLDPIVLNINLGTSLYIGIPRALIDGVADFFAAMTSHVLVLLLLFSLLIILLVFLLIVLGLVFAKLAARLFLALLATAPPHLTAVVALMRATTPVEIFLFIVLFAALLALLVPRVKFSLPLNQLLYAQLRLLFVHCQLFARPLQI